MNTISIFILVIIFLLIVLFFVYKYVYAIIKELDSNKKMILSLVKNDFKVKYAGSYLGITWAFVHPIITIMLYWIVFQYGLRVQIVDTSVPFAIWLITGLVPWFFISEAISNGNNGFIEYNYLVKKIVFKISIIPMIKVLSALLVHMVFIFFLISVYLIYQYGVLDIGFPNLYILQLPYYTVCAYIISLGIVYMISSITVFFKDLSQFISIMLQIGMWVTPILWNVAIIPEKYRWIIYINPIHYIIEGYRNALIGKLWFWQMPYQSLWFWFVTSVFFISGILIFKRLKPHFADVL